MIPVSSCTMRGKLGVALLVRDIGKTSSKDETAWFFSAVSAPQEEEEVLVINAWQRDEDSCIDYQQLG